MHKATTQFSENLTRAREFGNIASILTQLTNGTVDVTDTWRAQIVLGVSALDHLVHELARLGMLESAQGIRPKTDAFRKFQLPMAAVDLALTSAPNDVWLGEAIREKHSWLSFQHPDKIADAIRLVSAIQLWEEVGKIIGVDSKNVKIELQLIIERRNKIAHEADMDPTNPGHRWPITAKMASDSLDFIEAIGNAIHQAIT